jgi:hypothetical protein
VTTDEPPTGSRQLHSSEHEESPSTLITGEEIEIDEEKELSIVVDGQRSETDL